MTTENNTGKTSEVGKPTGVLEGMKKNIRKYKDLGYNPGDLLRFELEYETEFVWDDEEHDVLSETIFIRSFSISIEAVEDILDNDESYATTIWDGTVKYVRRYSTDELEEVDEPAYGGFSNTDGIAESGELYVDREMLLQADMVIE